MPPSTGFSTYLFDLDGTLIDSIELIMSSFRHTMERHLGDVPSEQDWRAGFGTPLRTQLARYARDAEQVAAMTSTWVAFTDEHHDRMVSPYPGVRNLLVTLHDAGVRLAVVTSKNRRAMQRGLTVCGLEEFFSTSVTTDDVEQHKPHPAPVIEALQRLEARPADTVFVGDSPHDVAAGRAAGVRTAAALWGPFERHSFDGQPPDFWLERPGDLSFRS